MPEARFETLFREELETLYDAEKQIIEALPKMIAATSNEELAGAFQDHLEETREQVRRLERVFEQMGEEPAVSEGQGMRGLLQEGENLIGKLEKTAVLDLGLIQAARKVEQYEICGYEIVRSLAEMLGQQDAADLLEETLDEETAASDLMTELADVILSGENVTDGDEELLLGEDDEMEDEEIIDGQEVAEERDRQRG